VDLYREREVVRREYASEERLLARASIYAGTGRDANDVLIEAIAEQSPEDILEVGCGPGRLAEMWMLVGLDRYPLPFNAENGAGILGRHFAHVDQHDISGTVSFPDREAIRSYIASSIKGRHVVDRIPEVAGPLSATWRCCILRAS
jgi:hypothetical protein